MTDNLRHTRQLYPNTDERYWKKVGGFPPKQNKYIKVIVAMNTGISVLRVIAIQILHYRQPLFVIEYICKTTLYLTHR